jgi:hypothetical protein
MHTKVWLENLLQSSHLNVGDRDAEDVKWVEESQNPIQWTSLSVMLNFSAFIIELFPQKWCVLYFEMNLAALNALFFRFHEIELYVCLS